MAKSAMCAFSLERKLYTELHQRIGSAGPSPEKDHKDDQKAGVPLREDRLRKLRSFSLKKTLGRRYIHLPTPKWSYKKERESFY